MKIIILLFVVLLISEMGFATETRVQKTQDFNALAFELLVEKVDTIKMEGDVKPNEKLKPILDDLGDFIGSHLFSIMSNDNDDYKGNIKDLTADCDVPSERNLPAKCQIIIQYKPIGETGITFYVGLDKDKKPESIINNRVQIDRGD